MAEQEGDEKPFREVRDELKARNRSGDIHWFRDGKNYYTRGTEKAIREAAKFRSDKLDKNPTLLMVMPAPSIYRHTHVNLTKAFVELYCPWKDEEVVLKNPQGNKWNVIWRGHGHQVPRIGRFSQFATSHRLDAGDVCIFEVQSYGFLVHVFKAKGKKDAICTTHPDTDNIHVKFLPQEPAEGEEEEVKANINSKLEELKFQIVFRKGSNGMIRPFMEIEMPLKEQQMNKFKGPFASVESLLDAIINNA